MKKKILVSFISLFLLFFGGITATLYIISTTTSNLQVLLTLHKVEIIRQDLVINVQTVQSNLYTAGTLFGKELDMIVDNVIRLDHRVESCSECHHEPTVEEDINDLASLTDQYKEALSYFITSTADSKRIERLQAVAADIGDMIIYSSQEMALSANEVLRRKTEIALHKFNNSKKILVFTLIIALFILLSIALYLVQSITRPISELLIATRKIRGGELGYTSTYKGRDEFKELIGSFNAMSTILQANNEKILAHMTRNQTILETSTDGFVLFDEEENIIDANPALCRMVGYFKDELLTMKFFDLESLDDEKSRVDHLKRIKQAQSLIFQIELTTKEETKVPVEISATYNEMEGKGNYFCFIRDISARLKMAEELLKGQKLESVGVLAGGIAHDFNNLLTGIIGYVDLSQKSVDQDDKIYSWLESAKRASVRAQGLTQQLLTFSKGGDPVKQLVQIKPLLVESTGFVLSGSNVRCDYFLPDNLWSVKADKGQISQVVQNITLNGAQAMPNGGVITVSAENFTVEENSFLPLLEGNYIMVKFEDHGTGIAKKDVKRIFDPYFSTKHTGNGLGLTICHSIVTKHNGLIGVESELEHGTVFTIYLPAEEKTDLLVGNEQKASTVSGAGTILVMDDEEQVRAITGEMLKHLGYAFDFAIDGVEAIQLYKQSIDQGKPYDLVIMDLTIPGGMGGQEAIAQLLELDPNVKAVVSSGYSNDPVMADYSMYGFSGVVTKPFDTKKLNTVLQDILG